MASDNKGNWHFDAPTPLQQTNREAWADTLVSGGYKQVEGTLCNTRLNKDQFCCLGVALDVFGWKGGFWKQTFEDGDMIDWVFAFSGLANPSLDSMPPKEFMKKRFGMSWDDTDVLAYCNDHGAKFATIAGFIRRGSVPKSRLIGWSSPDN